MTSLFIIGGMITAAAVGEYVAPRLSFLAHLINDTLILWGIG